MFKIILGSSLNDIDSNKMIKFILHFFIRPLMNGLRRHITEAMSKSLVNKLTARFVSEFLLWSLRERPDTKVVLKEFKGSFNIFGINSLNNFNTFYLQSDYLEWFRKVIQVDLNVLCDLKKVLLSCKVMKWRELSALLQV